VVNGQYSLIALGVEPVAIMRLFTPRLSGRSLAYLHKMFRLLDQDGDLVIGADAIEVIAMASAPWHGKDARKKQRLLTSGTLATGWRMRLDVNGDMSISLSEWVLFWARNSHGNPQKLRNLIASYRLYDVPRLQQLKRKGNLRDRYMLLFDVMDSDNSGSISLEELVVTLEKQPRTVQGGSVDQLASIQLLAMDHDQDGAISMSEWMTWATNRGDLDEMVAHNFHCFERSFGEPFGV